MSFELGVVIIMLVFFLSLVAVSFFMTNPYHGKPRYPVSGYSMTVSEIKELNERLAKDRLKAIEKANEEIVKGKLLRFTRKPWYKSSDNKGE